MGELRWILIGAGLLLLAGLWWWESRRKDRASSLQTTSEAEAEEGTDPNAAVVEDAAPAVRQEDLPSIRASRRERGTAGRNPPIVEIPADAEPELASARDDEFVPTKVPYRSMQTRLDELPEDLRDLPRDERAEADQRQPWVRTQPIDRNEVMGHSQQQELQPDTPAGDESAEDTGAEAGEDQSKIAARQKIVALRLIASGERWPGPTVVGALEAEGLSFGKYSIYHRERDDGKSIFFVASMVEPGSFDLENIDKLSFPGISIFAVVPGPVDAPIIFDMMLATARRLTDRLGGHLQDEQGSTLTAQRILNLREELVHFEHVTRRVQRH
jgi:cell division protein ZipA